ncbi:MAG: hypothetical protein M5R36_25685 [Deltaproteobacteria bacterium]|nr:hypothetical protein [Deltaproteobacteria bacterium]
MQKVVCDYFTLKHSELVGARKHKSFAVPRQIAAYLAREMTDASYPEIGQNFGGRDHTTIIHAHRKIGELRRRDPRTDQTVAEIESRLRGV